jgi:aminoglycoside 2'-N-acetyltransferase I
VDALVSLDRIDHLSDADRAAVRALSLAVYPPEEAAAWPGRHLEWTPAEWCVRIWADGELASYIGVVLRQATHDGRPVRVGGVGGVKTHPTARRRGYAGLGIRRAIEFLGEQGAGFALLVCEPHLIGYYARLGWQEFAGRLLVTQRGEPADFTFNRVLVQGVESAAPSAGTIDLCGPPW